MKDTDDKKLITNFRDFWGPNELFILGGNLSLHAAIQVILVFFIPLKNFVENSLHDGAAYFRISQNLWPDKPIFTFNYDKRILQPLLANIIFPWEKNISFIIIGIVAASLSAVFFYKIAKQYSSYPISLTAIYSLLPWLFYSAHIGLNEPLLLLFLLMGYYYFTKNQFTVYTISYALALLTKEIAIVPIFALAYLIITKYGWKRSIVFLSATLPFGLFCLIYGWHWNDCFWCAKSSPGNFFSLKTGFWWLYITLKNGAGISTNPVLSQLYNYFSVVLTIITIIIISIGVYRLRYVDKTLMVYNLLISLPLLFMGYHLYNDNLNMGRQFLISCLALVGIGGFLNRLRKLNYPKIKYLMFTTVLLAEFSLGIFWILVNTGFFLYNKPN